ncbi:hypothetical protein MASR2M15_09560 [Anaerolineales bacterium]
MALVKFMTSSTGRIARIVLGIVLILVGQFVVKDTAGTIITILALIPIAAGIFDVCILGAVLGYPFKGALAREKLRQQGQK